MVKKESGPELREVGATRSPLGVVTGLFVNLLEPLDESLDAGVVGEHTLRLRQVASEEAAQDRIEEEHGLAAQRMVWTARLEEEDGRSGKAAQLNLSRYELHGLLPELRLIPRIRHAGVTISSPLIAPSSHCDTDSWIPQAACSTLPDRSDQWF